MHAVVILIVGPAFCWMAVTEKVNSAAIFPFGFFAVLALLALSRRRENCPDCQNDVSSLPDEGKPFQLAGPELSRKVICCPFCGADLAWQSRVGPAGERTV